MCISLQLAPADVEELRKKLKAVVERTRMLEWQRNEEAKKVDRLREEMEVSMVVGLHIIGCV